MNQPRRPVRDSAAELPRRRGLRLRWCSAALVAALASVLLTQGTESAQGKADDEVKAAFGKLQEGIKAKDAAKIWALLDSATQADAERQAKLVKASYNKANDKGKAKQQESLGLKGEEFPKLDGPMLIRTKVFLAKYDEIPDSKITAISVQGDSAVLNYLEADGDKEKLSYTRQDGKWKVALPIPAFPK